MSKIWTDLNMHTLADYLKWYNCQDVIPFLQAITNQFEYFRDLEIDMFRDGISLPGLCSKYLFRNYGRDKFYMLGRRDLYELFKQNLVGGPSIVFTRIQQCDKTKIRLNEYGSKAHPSHTILDYDGNKSKFKNIKYLYKQLHIDIFEP